MSVLRITYQYAVNMRDASILLAHISVPAYLAMLAMDLFVKVGIISIKI